MKVFKNIFISATALGLSAGFYACKKDVDPAPVVVTPSTEPASLLAGIVNRYDFLGNANDLKGTANGTVTGATLTADRKGKADAAYMFDGKSHISLGNINLPDAQFSYSAWVKPSESKGGTQNIFSKHKSGTDALILRLNNSNKYTFEITLGGMFYNIATEKSPSITKYDLLTVTYNNAVFKYYVNGELAAEKAVTGAITKNSLPFTLGKWAANASEYYTGAIDDLRIYDRALSADEAKELYKW